ncbi:DNA replication/repair protein RecF [Erythrobacter arachoides]|uniref:DNA replication and repair protein RecF n=1 Tax=Aurantiacibacter arachoides TaxID=1850444 RepID=A0A844ZXA6_9SPHN|nr:DNA replication/repair protein RecF [Aurantiacibacter arachoides]MXO92525.1 DNA replication/repair protein RecF [Aurantiacibacter arachoides]GGD56508.1 DNA replication and repair protein RecF [Aurantiacibacter arachoides]
MALDRISLATFRNHVDTRLDDTRQINLLVGENGAGKTNVLEALSLFAPGRGLRRAGLADMAGKHAPGADDAQGFGVGARLLTRDGGQPVQLGTALRGSRRIVQVNGAETSAVSLGEWLAMGWLTPAMDRLFADSAGARRRYVDRLAVALDPVHARPAARYEAALRERNRLLSDEREPDPAWLDSIDAQLAAAGGALAEGRGRLVDALVAELAALPTEPFARPALALATSGARTEGDLRTQLAANRRRDRAAQRTLMGPHRDDLLVTMEGKAMPAAECSTGEQKAMLIAITLAHAALAARGRPSLLLLDEVAAHLDPVRREALFARLRDSGTQVWLTGTEIAPFEDIVGEAAIWRVAEGRAERL